jgi:two-component system, chemotaxis family, protein-glutamate methylesterase/glutaminase
MSAPYRVMLADDSAVVRGYFQQVIELDSDIEVVAVVNNGQMAVDKIQTIDIDVLLLDIEMPVLDGLSAIPLILAASPSVQIIMVSTLTTRNARISLDALKLGAHDYIQKPDSNKNLTNDEVFRHQLLEKVKALGARKRYKFESKKQFSAEKKLPVGSAKAAVKTNYDDVKLNYTLHKKNMQPTHVIAVASSTGGPDALNAFLKNLPSNINVPIFITQHMPELFTAQLAKHLTKDTGRECAEGIDGEIVKNKRVYLAPGGRHMMIEQDENNRKIIKIVDDAPINYCKPSADIMVNSIVDCYGGNVLFVVLTGMGKDGYDGGCKVIEAGGNIIAQDELTSVVWGMPGAVATDGLCSAVLPLSDIPLKLNDYMIRAAA